MSYGMFSDEFAQACATAINNSEGYRDAAKDWSDPIVLAVTADPGHGVPERAAAYFDVARGECKAGRLASAEDEAQAPYVISASPQTWKKIYDGKIDVGAALMRGTLEIEKGSKSKLMAEIDASEYLVEAVRSLDVEFPDELR